MSSEKLPELFPFPAEIEVEGKPPLKVSVLKLNDIGFMADVGAQILQTGGVLKVKLFLVGRLDPLVCAARIVKTYDRIQKKRIVEFHFLKSTLALRNEARSYTLAAKNKRKKQS